MRGLALASCALAAWSARAQPAGPALRVIKAEAPVYATPNEDGKLRGTLLQGARFAAPARVDGQGCGDGRFVQLGADAFACARDFVEVERVREAAPDAGSKERDLPYEYLQTTHDGVSAYAAPEDSLTDDYSTALGKGFVVAVAERVRFRDTSFVHTLAGLYVAERELRPLPASDFHGVSLEPSASLAQVGFVVREGAEIRAADGDAIVRKAHRLERVAIGSELAPDRLALVDGTVIDARAVKRPRLRPPPEGLLPGERYVDVDLARQILVVYEGERPIFATLISSGRDRKETRTPRGAFRIWAKLRESDMRDSEHVTLEQSYAIEHVPWVQYFEHGYALHAAFWHDRFGETHSRGCVNLSPADARTVFELTSPALPKGWFAVHPSEQERGTLVVVR